jgi:hypothetical protein
MPCVGLSRGHGSAAGGERKAPPKRIFQRGHWTVFIGEQRGLRLLHQVYGSQRVGGGHVWPCSLDSLNGKHGLDHVVLTDCLGNLKSLPDDVLKAQVNVGNIAIKTDLLGVYRHNQPGRRKRLGA